MAEPSTTTRLLVLLFLFHQICGNVIPVPEEMVPDNLMIRDRDSESGFSIDQDVLKQLLEKVYSSSIVKRRDMVYNQAECRECEDEEEVNQDNLEEQAEENTDHQAEYSNTCHQGMRQITENKYNNAPLQNQNVRSKEHRTIQHPSIHEHVHSGMETSNSPHPPAVPQRQIEQAPDSNNGYQSTGAEYQTISGQYPFTEFSPKAFDRSKQIKTPSVKQYFIQDSSQGMQHSYEQQQTAVRPRSQSDLQTFAFCGRQSVPQEPQEPTQRDFVTADYRQYGNQPSRRLTSENCQPSQVPPQSPQRLQIGNVSVRRSSSA